MATVFSNFRLKIPKIGILVPNLIFIVLHEILHFDKFEGADFKYDKNSSKW